MHSDHSQRFFHYTGCHAPATDVRDGSIAIKRKQKAAKEMCELCSSKALGPRWTDLRNLKPKRNSQLFAQQSHTVSARFAQNIDTCVLRLSSSPLFGTDHATSQNVTLSEPDCARKTNIQSVHVTLLYLWAANGNRPTSNRSRL